MLGKLDPEENVMKDIPLEDAPKDLTKDKKDKPNKPIQQDKSV